MKHMKERITTPMKQPFRCCVAALFVLMLNGCGVGQSIKDSTVDAAKWAFTTQVKTMNLDLVSRASLNANGSGQSLSTVVRIYQLKTPQAFEKLNYAQLQTNDLAALKADVLSTRDVVLRPDSSASISDAMNDAAEYVGVVAFFRGKGKNSTWKLLVPKAQWKQTDPVKIEVQDNSLQSFGATPESIKRDVPLQSTPTAKSATAPSHDMQTG